VRAWAVAPVILAAILLGACASPPPGSPAAASAPLTPAATPTPEPVAGPSDEEIREAMRERQDFGLRADEAWVRAVAANPNASSDMLGIPLLPAEEVEFQSRQERLRGVAGLAQRYAGDHPKDFAGLFIDQEHRLVVILFTADVEAHQAALAKLIPGDDDLLAVRLATSSRADLEALMDRIAKDDDWFRTIDAKLMGAGLDEIHNLVDVEISSANAAAPGLIADHFGAGPALLKVTSDGTGIELQPKGKVRGRVVNADGSPALGDGSLTVNWASDHPGAGSGDCGGGDIGYGVGEHGRFELPCAPGRWTISITSDDDGNVTELGRAHVVVPPGLAVDLVIHLDR
jgi:hypothetical protein